MTGTVPSDNGEDVEKKLISQEELFKCSKQHYSSPQYYLIQDPLWNWLCFKRKNNKLQNNVVFNILKAHLNLKKNPNNYK